MAWWQTVVGLAGLTLQIVGTGLAVRGLLSTWSVYATDPLIPVWTRVERRLRTLGARAQSLLFGPRQVEVHPQDTVTSIGEALTAAVIAWDGMPTDRDEAIRELDRRTQYVMMQVVRFDRESRQAVDQIRADLGLVLVDEAAKRAAEDRAVATGGVKMAVTGLLVVMTGIGVQLAANLWVLLTLPA